MSDVGTTTAVEELRAPLRQKQSGKNDENDRYHECALDFKDRGTDRSWSDRAQSACLFAAGIDALSGASAASLDRQFG